jgi:uncharacterized protein (DUF427 family)
MSERPVENVWDYPRPPSVAPSDEHLVVVLGGQVVAESSSSWRVCETSHPPTYYLPADAFAAGALRPTDGATVCEWKGVASYFDVVAGERVVASGAWTYPDPPARYAGLVGHVAIYPGRMDRCTVDGEVVQAQDGDFYGGWITSRVVGPFKGAPGTLGW